MSSGKITRFQNNLRVDGNLDLSNSTGKLTLSSLSSAPSSPAVGMSYYDTTLRKARIYQDSGWTAVDGTAAGSLDAAYNGGASVTVDAGAVTLNDATTSTQGALLITKSGAITGADSASLFHINSTGAHDTSGDVKFLEISVGAETISGSPIGLEIEMNANGDDGILVTKGAITLTDGAVVLTSGALTLTSGNFTMSSGNADVTGTLAISGTSTLAAINNSGAITSQGIVIIDVDNAEAFLIRENADAADVLTVDTTQDAGDTTMLLTTKVTTGTGVHIDGSTITSGDALKITVAAATMTGAGAALSVVADGTEVFAIRDDGSAVSITGTAEGTTALGVTTGDVLISDGDLTLSGGELSVTDGVTTSGAGLTLVSSVTSAIGFDLSVAALTTGKAIDISNLDAIISGKAIHIDATGITQTSGVLVHIDSASTALTTNGRLLLVDATGDFNDAGGIVAEIKSVHTTGTGMQMTMDAVTDGIGVFMTIDALTSGQGISIASSATAITGNGRLLRVDHTGTTGTTAILSEFASAATDETDILRVTASGALTGVAFAVNATSMVAGTGIKIDTIQTSGSALHIDNASGVQANNTGMVFLDHGGNMAIGSNILRIAPTGTPVEQSVGIEIVGGSKLMQGLIVDSDAATQSANIFSGDGARGANTGVVEILSNSASGSNADSAVLRVIQDHTGGVSYCVDLQQDDLNVGFINFQGTASADSNSPISTLNSGTVTDHVRAAINGTLAWIPVITGALS